MTFVPPQLLLATSLLLMATELQPSVAVAVPVLFGLVFAGQSSRRFGGAVIVGGCVSTSVISCTLFVELPQSSVATHIREITFAPPQELLTESEYVSVTLLQPSVVTAVPVLLVAVLAGHSITIFDGTIRLGLIVSRMAIVCTPLVVLPH